MLFQIILNFLLSFLLLNLYLTKSNFNYLYDKNQSGFGSNKKTLTGSGIIFSIVLLINLIFYNFNINYIELLPNRFYIFILSVVLLSFISFYDDIKPLDPRVRLIAQIIIIYFSLTLIDLEYFDLPLKLMIFLSLIFWIYITNITNFIDGSDGYLSVNAISFFLGIIIINQFYPEEFFSNYLAIIFFPILFSFIYFNKPKAKIYMGDTGSILIGYIIGFCLLELILSDYWYLAISLYFYPFLDCTLTLIKKIISGKSVFKRDFDYFFLKPIKKIQKNNYKVLGISIIYNFLNLMVIISVIYFQLPLLIIISIFLSLIKIRIFSSI